MNLARLCGSRAHMPLSGPSTIASCPCSFRKVSSLASVRCRESDQHKACASHSERAHGHAVNVRQEVLRDDADPKGP